MMMLTTYIAAVDFVTAATDGDDDDDDDDDEDYDCEYTVETSNTSRTLTGSKLVDHSDVVGTSPVGAAPTASSFST